MSIQIQCYQAPLETLSVHMFGVQLFFALQGPFFSMAKRGNIRSALEVARMARDLLGANGMCDECVAFRHMANLTAQSTTDGTDHIHSLIIGQALTGYSAYV